MSAAKPMGDRRRETAYGVQNGTGPKLVRLTARQRRRWLHKRNAAAARVRAGKSS